MSDGCGELHRAAKASQRIIIVPVSQHARDMETDIDTGTIERYYCQVFYPRRCLGSKSAPLPRPQPHLHLLHGCILHRRALHLDLSPADHAIHMIVLKENLDHRIKALPVDGLEDQGKDSKLLTSCIKKPTSFSNMSLYVQLWSHQLAQHQQHNTTIPFKYSQDC